MSGHHDTPPRRILLTGCSGGGKSTLLTALSESGSRCVAEPGRRIIAQVRAGQGGALPWDDPMGFAEQALTMAQADFRAAGAGVTIFDRGLIDAACALGAVTQERLIELLGGLRYDDPVLLAPPWPELFLTDADRRHGFDAAQAEYARIETALALLGHKVCVLPKASVPARVDIVRNALAED